MVAGLNEINHRMYGRVVPVLYRFYASVTIGSK